MFVRLTSNENDLPLWLKATSVTSVWRDLGEKYTEVHTRSGRFTTKEEPHVVVELLEQALGGEKLKRCPECNGICLHHVTTTTCAECSWNSKQGD